MATHEASCTMNPQRKCYMCEATQDYFNLICAMRARDDVEFEDEFGNGEPMDKPFWKTESKEAIEIGRAHV